MHSECENHRRSAFDRVYLLGTFVINLFVVLFIHVYHFLVNKCIGYDTKAAARQSLNCIKNKK